MTDTPKDNRPEELTHSDPSYYCDTCGTHIVAGACDCTKMQRPVLIGDDQPTPKVSVPGEERPERAHVLISSVGADTAMDLSLELRHLADLIERDQLSTGCSGSPSGGSLYSYKIRPEQTHDVYFQQIEEWLAAREDATASKNRAVVSAGGDTVERSGG